MLDLIRHQFSVIILVLLSHGAFGQDEWQSDDETSIDGSINTTISQGYIFKIDGSFYIVDRPTRQPLKARNPAVKISRRGYDYRLEIETLDEPLICRKLDNVVETQIQGQFNGWNGETIFKMLNGQIWQQASLGIHHHYIYSPKVLIYEVNGSWIMKVAEVDQTLQVKKLNRTPLAAPIGDGEVIETEIDGEFKGWDGETIFKMRNGQVWQQATSGYRYANAHSPDVMIYRSGLSWKMKVEGLDEALEVKQIK